MSTVIGIDLGTSTTEAAVFRNGKPEMILNLEKSAITPSAVGIDQGGNWIVGSRALAQHLLYPENTAIEVKRKTGTDERIPIGKATYTPVELQSRLLSYVRAYASEYLGEDITRAVISVPAYFNDHQRRETYLAGEMAGFSVERILNEPTAAALSYGLEHMDEESHILVYDLGGGTFDVTLLEMFDGVLEVKASSGNNQLGGKDFDERLMEHLIKSFEQKHRYDLRKDKRAMVRLKEEAEKCKIALSEQEACRVLLPALCMLNGSPVEMDVTVSRKQFEAMTSDLLEATHDPIDQVLTDTDLTDSDIDRIILVGGSTRMPMVREDLARFMGQAPEQAVHPDFAVAEGAAVMAGMIMGEIDESESLIMTDVNPFTLGIRTGDGFNNDQMSVIIPRNTTIPTTRTEQYVTISNYQTTAKIEVYQGESGIATHNHYLGEFELGGIPRKPAGQEKLDVSFSYDRNGLLTVTAVIVSNKKQASIEINMSKGKDQTADVSKWKDAEGSGEYRPLIRMAERTLSRQSLTGGEKERMETLVYALKEALIQGRLDTAHETGHKLEHLLNETRRPT